MPSPLRSPFHVVRYVPIFAAVLRLPWQRCEHRLRRKRWQCILPQLGRVARLGQLGAVHRVS